MKKSIEEMTDQEILDAIESGLAEVVPRLASGELNPAGRYWTDVELAEAAATSSEPPSAKPSEASAA